MVQSLYRHIHETFKNAENKFGSVGWERMVAWRHGPVFVRVERPLRLDRARAVGYKAKPGFVIVRARVRRGGRRKERFDGGRMPSKMGVNKITMRKNLQWMAEERVAKRYPNMQVLNSYWVGQDGQSKYYEVILVDPSHPAIAKNPHTRFVADPGNRKRVLRGKTSAGQKARGLRWKGMGSEHTRPSVRKSFWRTKANRTHTQRKNFRALP